MAYTTINKSSDYFNTKIYEGNGSSPRSITGVGFQPDFTWTKNRDNTNGHGLFDAVRGYATGYGLSTHNANAEGSADAYGYLSSRDSDGYTMTAGGSGMTMNNTNGESYASWNWKANGAGVANTDGTISSTVSANTTSGFSIVTYTGNGTVNSTVGHGLGTVPEFIIVKSRSGNGTAWGTKNPAYNSPSDPQVLYLNNANSTDSAQNVWGSSASFTTSTFTVGDWGGSNNNSSTYVAYCFSSKTGYSKFGSYTGNGNADGTFVYTGFKPKWLLIRRTDVGDGWMMYDDKRIGYNPNNYLLETHTNTAEYSSDRMDLLSNGFKPRYNWSAINASSGNYIYMAFGQSLVGSNGVTAKAR